MQRICQRKGNLKKETETKRKCVGLQYYGYGIDPTKHPGQQRLVRDLVLRNENIEPQKLAMICKVTTSPKQQEILHDRFGRYN